MITTDEKKEIISSLEIQNLSKEDQDKVIKKLEENIEKSVVLTILDTLKKEDKEELEKIINTTKENDILSFLKLRNPLFYNIAKAVAVSVVRDFKILRGRN